MLKLSKVICCSIVLTAAIFCVKSAQGASITGSVLLEDGTPLTPRFSVRAVGPTTLNSTLDASGNFSFTGIAAGTYQLSLITPGYAYGSFGMVTLSTPDAASTHNAKITDGSWARLALTQPDGSTAITDDLLYTVVCPSKNFRVQSYGGVLLTNLPPNQKCQVSYYRGTLSGPYVPPDKYTFTSAASGLLNLGALRTRTPNLYGTVLDRNGAPVKDLNVTLHDAQVKQTTTNASGIYTFVAKPGTYNLTFGNPSNPSVRGYGVPCQDVTIPVSGSVVNDTTLREPNIQGSFVDREGNNITAWSRLRLFGARSTCAISLTRAFNAYIPPGTYTSEVEINGYYTAQRPLTVSSEDLTAVTLRSGWKVSPFVAIEKKPNVRATITATQNKKTTKKTVGLNVHWSHVNERYDEMMFEVLQSTNTRWVREWFKAGTYPNTRFNFTIQRYRDLGINVVGMLAYNPPPFNQNAANLKALSAWKDYVQKVVRTYKSYIRVWEVWNEPNYIHLNPPTVGAYLPYLRAAGEIIRQEDPGAIILNGGLSWPDAKWAEALLRSNTGKKYIDRFAFHIYYCDMYAKYGDNRRLKSDLAKLKKVLDKYRRGQKAWVTEMGCSLKTKGITEAKRLKYTKETVPWLLKQGWIQNIFWYTTLDGTGPDPYENFFGLYTYPTIKPRTIADWYKNIPK